MLKSEPDEFSIRDLAMRPEQTEPWDGVRSYQARNIMQGMRVADQCLFYHSNTKQVLGTTSHSVIIQPGLWIAQATQLNKKGLCSRSSAAGIKRCPARLCMVAT